MASDPSPVGQTMRAIGARHFGGRVNDRAACLAGLEAHVTAVRRDMPADRLLVFNIAEGWEPLCRFLGVPVPDAPFPRANTTDEFLAHAAEMIALSKSGGPPTVQ
jgi:hypothetical protein